MPTFSIFGWQKPCYLLQDGYADTFEELMETTNWENYGAKSGNPQCANCMVHSGHEATAVDYNFSSLKGFLVSAKKYMFPSLYPDTGAQKLLNEWKPAHAMPLVQIQSTAKDELQPVSGGLSTMATEQQEHLKIEQLRQQSADEVEVIAGREKENL